MVVEEFEDYTGFGEVITAGLDCESARRASVLPVSIRRPLVQFCTRSPPSCMYGQHVSDSYSQSLATGVWSLADIVACRDSPLPLE